MIDAVDSAKRLAEVGECLRQELDGLVYQRPRIFRHEKSLNEISHRYTRRQTTGDLPVETMSIPALGMSTIGQASGPVPSYC